MCTWGEGSHSRITTRGLLCPHTAHLGTFSLENQPTCPSFPSTASAGGQEHTFSFQILFTRHRSPRKQMFFAFWGLRGQGSNDPSLATSVLPLQWVPCSISALRHKGLTEQQSLVRQVLVCMVQPCPLQGSCLLLLGIPPPYRVGRIEGDSTAAVLALIMND